MTPKQLQFCREYIVDLNATQSAIRAGYSPRTARSLGQRLLTYVDVANEIQRLIRERSERTEITADDVVRELARICRFDVRKLYNDDGSMKQVTELDDDVALAIQSIEVSDIQSDDSRITQTKKLRSACKLKALELLGRHLAMFTDRHEVKTNQPQVHVYFPDNGRDTKPKT